MELVLHSGSHPLVAVYIVVMGREFKRVAWDDGPGVIGVEAAAKLSGRRQVVGVEDK